MAAPVCAVSVDLDPVRCYYDIHGLGAPPGGLADVVIRRGLARFVELLGRRGIAATFFVVGRDLDGEAGAPSRAELARAAAAGHELGNHSWEHLYDLTRRPAEVIRDEIARAHQAIAAVAGAEPVGFRAPGYTVNAALITEVAAQGYRYDSSLLPAPPYYAAKALAMAAMRLGGRTSRSILGDPRQLFGGRLPYRLDEQVPWRRGHARLVELPVTVTRALRLPVIGTSLLALPEVVRKRLLAGVRGLPFFNFELHGIDLVDADSDGVPMELVRHRPELKIAIDRRLDALDRTLATIADWGFRFAPLREVAAAVE